MPSYLFFSWCRMNTSTPACFRNSSFLWQASMGLRDRTRLLGPRNRTPCCTRRTYAMLVGGPPPPCRRSRSGRAESDEVTPWLPIRSWYETTETTRSEISGVRACMETMGVGWLQLPLIYSVIAVITGNYRASGCNKELLLLRDYPSKTPGRAVTGNYRNSTGIPVTEESVTTRQAQGQTRVYQNLCAQLERATC